MMTIKLFGMASALGVALLGSAAPIARANPAVQTPPLAAGQPFTSPRDAGLPTLLAAAPKIEPDLGNLEKAGQGNKKPDKITRPNRPDKPDKPGRKDYPDSVQQRLKEIADQQTKFLDEQKDFQERIKRATRAEREKLRAEMREKREQFLQHQKEMREDFRKQLKDHGDVFDNVQEQTREKIKERKGGKD